MKKQKTDPQLLLNSIYEVSKKYEISRDKVLEIFVESINKVLTKLHPEIIFKINANNETGEIKCFIEYDVIDDNQEDYDDLIQIHLTEAKKHHKNINIGDKCLVDFDIYDTDNLSKQQIIQIMQIFKQRLNELNNIKVYKDWSPRVDTLITADVDKFETRSNSFLIDLKDGNFGFLSKSESIPGEKLIPGSKYQFLVKEVKEHTKGWPVILSRADERFVIKLLEEIVPEIASGDIIIEVIKRIPGFKTKIAVKNSSLVNTFDPAAVVVGSKGNRIKNLSNQINGEKVEIVKYSDDLKTFLMNLCGQNIVGYNILLNKNNNEDKPHITLIVTENTLPVIIGKKGFNIKLIANMLDATVDIHTVEQAKELKIDYITIEHQNQNKQETKQIDKYNKSKINSFKSPKANINNKVVISNEELLDNINSLSEDEIKKLFNIDVQENLDNHKANVETSNQLDNDENNEFEDNDLTNAFASEIANVIGNNNKEKQ